MKTLFSKEEFENSKGSDKLPCECYKCGNTFYREKREISYELRSNRGNIKYCSLKCVQYDKNAHITQNCNTCGKTITKKLSIGKKSKSGFIFCSTSCSTTYNNKHKSFGVRRSKLEMYIEEQLNQLYPNLEIHYNRKDGINSELDIYIPSLKLAFELNGIFHYEPIYGLDKLEKTKLNDTNKFQQCQNNNISLCIIDTTSMKNFKPDKGKMFLNIITDIIQENISLTS
jgi:hypothetical protein